MSYFFNSADFIGHNPDPHRFYKATIASSPRFLAGLDCYAPGQGDRDHTHAGHDKIYYVIAGVGEFTVAGEQQRCGPGAVVWAPADVAHSVVNPGPDDLTVFIVMSPLPQ